MIHSHDQSNWQFAPCTSQSGGSLWNELLLHVHLLHEPWKAIFHWKCWSYPVAREKIMMRYASAGGYCRWSIIWCVMWKRSSETMTSVGGKKRDKNKKACVHEINITRGNGGLNYLMITCGKQCAETLENERQKLCECSIHKVPLWDFTRHGWQ